MNRYIKAIKRMSESLDPLCKKYNVPRIYFWINALLATIRYGVTPNQYISFRFWEKSSLEKKQFYTRRQHYKLEKKLNDRRFYKTFWDKEKFNEAFKDFVNREWIFCQTASDKEIEEFVKNHKTCLVKPQALSAGRGIHIYNSNDSFDKLRNEKCLLEEYVIQAKKMAELNPSSVNTIRVYTLLNNNTVIFLSATLRVGGADAVVDNFHTGGVAYPIDCEYGIITAAGRNIQGETYLYHPTTNKKMIGFEIPHWYELKQFISVACFVIPTARLIAWDVAILENGFEMIEGNYNGNPDIMQSPSNTGKLKEILRNI